MSVTRADIVAEARSWVGTPFLWQAAVKGRGCDCKGLVAGVAAALALPGADAAEALRADYAIVDARALRAGVAAIFDPVPVERMQGGDVVLIHVAQQVQHMAILTAPERMVHSYARGPRCVIEVPVAGWRIVSAWGWRGVAA